MYYPSAPLVFSIWAGTQNLPTDGISDNLPADPTLWATRGYLQIPMTVGGSGPDVDIPMRAPTVQADAWTCSVDSEQAPWNLAEHLAASLLYAAQDMRQSVALPMPTGFYPVRLHAIWPQTDPRRLPGDPSGYARVTADYDLRYVVLR